MDKRYEELLSQVQRPARYIGNEVNAIVKDWDSVELKTALAFPDVYDIGMSNLGMKILYHILNARPNILCERVFAPWPDMERLLRGKGLPLISLENKKPLSDFDIIGFTLSHELNYTNTLNILDMSGIPIRSGLRKESDPLVIAGGPCAFNPEPMSEFIDLFLIGDGEEAILELMDCYLRCVKGKKAQGDRKKILREFSKIRGIYVPSLYDAIYVDGVFSELVPFEKNISRTIKKRHVPDLNKSFYPVKQILSYVPLVHDRISLEVMRGCPHRCRFCQATAIYSPKRLRRKEKVIDLARASERETGHDEISLLSLSSGDYPGITDVLQILVNDFRPKGVSISLPSLRIKKGIENLPAAVGQIKKTGFTFAPEVGSERLRKFINKNIDGKALLGGVKNAYEVGWRRVKLYFMIGFSGEGNEDLDAMIEAITAVSKLMPKDKKRVRDIIVSISPFIPKPHTPLQWERMAPRELLEKKADYIKHNINCRRVKINVHNIDMSGLEAVFSRGDRRLSRVIGAAFYGGARFDNWSDLLKIDIWRKAFLKCGIDSEDYLRKREYSESLPWDHIQAGPSKKALIGENIAAHAML